jgi:hypothetical protein
VLLGNGDGTFGQTAVTSDAGAAPLALAVADFNGDGNPDLAVTQFDGNTVNVLLGNGDGTFQTGPSYTVGSGLHSSPFAVAVADFNRDGISDLVTANYNSDNVSVLLGNGDGTFQAATNYDTDLNAVSVAVGDFNGDGFPDLAAANHYGDNVSVLRNAKDWSAPSSGVPPLGLSSPASTGASPLVGQTTNERTEAALALPAAATADGFTVPPAKEEGGWAERMPARVTAQPLRWEDPALEPKLVGEMVPF